MLKNLAFFALPLLVISVQTYAQTNKTQHAAKNSQPTAPVAPIAPQQSSGQSVQPETKKHVDADVRVLSAPEKDIYDKAAFWATIALALVGIVGIRVGVRSLDAIRRQVEVMERQTTQASHMSSQVGLMESQLGEMRSQREQTVEEMRRQAEILREQTKAAARNTEAFINKERSRLFLSTVTISEDYEFEIVTTNRGQSPALVTYKFVGCELLRPDTESLPAVPRYTDWGEPSDDYVADDWIVPKASMKLGGYDASWVRDPSNELEGEILEGRMVLWYFGILIYQDTVSADQHTIKFCFRCHPSKSGHHWLTEEGPDAYRGET